MKIEGKSQTQYPETFAEFQKITQFMYDLFSSKQADYGPTNIGMGQSVVVEDEHVKKSMLALSVRMNDKVQRLLNMTFNDHMPNHESLEDTLVDIANYAVMAIIVNRKKWGK